jgi:hypothetical protein
MCPTAVKVCVKINFLLSLSNDVKVLHTSYHFRNYFSHTAEWAEVREVNTTISGGTSNNSFYSLRNAPKPD